MAFNSANFAIRSVDEVAVVLRDAAIRDIRVAWSDNDGRSGSAILTLAGSNVVLVVDDRMPSGVVRLLFAMYGLPFFVRCRLLDGGIVMPIEIWSEDSRRSARISPSTPMYLEWHSVAPGYLQTHRVPLIDIGAGGGRTFHQQGGPIPSEKLFPATITANGTFTHAMVEVCSRRPTAEGTELGLKLHSDIPLADVMLRTLFPRLSLRRELPAARVADLLERSGYLSLRSGTTPSPAWFSLNADSLSRDFVYVAEDAALVGHASITRAYSTGWIGHQVATISNHADSIHARRQLYLGMAMVPTLFDGLAATTLSYYDRSKPWHQIFFEEFARSVASTRLAVITPLDRFERSASASHDWSYEAPAHVRVGLASDRELAAVAELARASVPQLLATVLDLEPSSVRSSSLHNGFRQAKLKREREVLVVYDHDRMVGAALCEHTTRALSLFNIMNMAYVFVAGRSVSGPAQLALQQAVRKHYAERGIADPLIVSPAGTFDATLDPDVRLAETMGCISWSALGLRAFENYVSLRFAWLLQGLRATGTPRTMTA